MEVEIEKTTVCRGYRIPGAHFPTSMLVSQSVENLAPMMDLEAKHFTRTTAFSVPYF